MKAVFYFFSILIFFIFLSGNVTAAPNKILWDAFYEKAKAVQLNEPIKTYALNEQNKKMCFIYKNQIFFFINSKITKPVYAKKINVAGINRITSIEKRYTTFFILWSNEKIIMEFGR